MNKDQPAVDIPAWQQAIRDKSYHPTGTFIPFEEKEIQQSISERFEKIVDLYPDRLAIKDGDQQLTYDELNQWANVIAHAILELRGEGQEPIALLFGHDAQVIAAILGTLKAGKFYMPIDSSYPAARVSHMLDDSHGNVILTNTPNVTLAKVYAKNKRWQLINIDELDSDLPVKNPSVHIPPDNIAYVLYTSGSTGQPKGVVENHRNLLHQIMNWTNSLHVGSEDRQTLLESCSFSGSIPNIYSSLLNGAALCLLDLKKQGMAHLADWLNLEGITIYRSVPTIFRVLAGNLPGELESQSLRLIVLTGESVHQRDMELYKRHFSKDCILVNNLGLTEAGSIRHYFMDHHTLNVGSIVPVGYPVSGMEILLLDEYGKEVGFNEAGEVAVRSRYMSPGYWEKPDETGFQFLPDPEGGDRRIYFTGDMGMMDSDGCLNIIGRKDFQVKIRGYRVEIGEIETALLKIDNVKEAVVVLREDRPGDQRLVAYFTPESGTAPAATELRRGLSETLPDYMIPFAFVKLESLPQTPNGKVDRHALPSPGRSRENRI
jgi:amino acid adenylation domain-containing protein